MSASRRSAASVVAAPFRRRNYRALANSVRRYRRPAAGLWRYVTGRGSYPYVCRIRTSLGEIAATLPGPHDMLTVNEVFCSIDYPTPPEATVIVDVGSNIGISALYFLTEAPASHCHLFEPNAELLETLRANLSGFEDRVSISEVAVTAAGGTVAFGIEETGRYGGVGVNTGRTVRVESRPIAEVLDDVLSNAQRIDILKLDIEGIELEVLASIPTPMLERIEAIYVETASGQNPLPGLFDFERERLVSRLRRRRSR